jgi:hypothetical protein
MHEGNFHVCIKLCRSYKNHKNIVLLPSRERERIKSRNKSTTLYGIDMIYILLLTPAGSAKKIDWAQMGVE